MTKLAIIGEGPVGLTLLAYLLYIKGAVPGPKEGIVYIKKQ